ncbi:hypothetical protein TPA0910_23750 [Streptomyces hygroscopicus subsp. sporocinereus]|uniref:Uncharacterized protein n=1 Tax=Streptomyces hygroscopicus TaxID=1912 RepID=A0ABQ3TX76_STRHY|nr:hypothetical protein TPA0910_23750 [Streptomyces hygroscopicus]
MRERPLPCRAGWEGADTTVKYLFLYWTHQSSTAKRRSGAGRDSCQQPNLDSTVQSNFPGKNMRFGLEGEECDLSQG